MHGRAPRALSAEGPRSGRAGGFTLVEILVVVVILAVAAGVGLAALRPDEPGALRREAARAGGALEHAAARAQVRAETLGVDAAGDRLRFWRRDARDRWTLVTDDDVLAEHPLPAPLDIAGRSYGGRPLGPRTIAPLRPSGRNDPSSYVLRTPTLQVVIALDPLNRVSIGGIEASAP